jgi:hypothetical protein
MSTFDEAVEDIKKAKSVLEDKSAINIQPKDTSKGHFYVSLVKSGFRIAAGVALIWPQNIVLAGGLLIAAEVLGILEEVV